MINLTIDNKKVSVPKGTSIMEAARKNGIDIPGFCYHPKLDSFGACRVCMVHVTERGRTSDKFACAQPVGEGMEVVTKSDKINKYVKSVTEYLLIHHPLDCPICDKSGECELQDVSFKLKLSKGRIKSKRKNSPSVKNNPVLEFNHNRCILCGRCTRICSEVQGIAAIDFQKRGFNTEIGTPVGKPLDCEFCGQCLSVCPVGAIQDRVLNFRGRSWEFKKTKTTCTYCSVGCTLFLNTKNNEVLRITSDDDAGINNGNLCSKGRFGFQFIHSNARIKEPLIKENGKLAPTTWENALEVISNKFNEIKNNNGAESIGGIGSEKCTNEENYLFQKFFRVVLGSNTIDNMANIRAPFLNELIYESISSGVCSNSLEKIQEADLVFLFGTDIIEEYPVAGNMARKAIKENGASLIIANVRNVDFKSVAQTDLRINYNYSAEHAFLNALMKLMIDENLVDIDNIEHNTNNFGEFKEFLVNSDINDFLNEAGADRDQMFKIAESLSASNNRAICVGKEILNHPAGKDGLRSLLNLAYLTMYGCGTKGGTVAHGTSNVYFSREHNNSQGVNDMGVVPDYFPGYQGYSVSENRGKFSKKWAESVKGSTLSIPERLSSDGNIFDLAIQGKLKALYIMGDNPILSHIDGREAREAINKLEFTVVQDSFLTETAFMADVVLPSTTFAEKEGTFVNSGRSVQKVNKAIDSLNGSTADSEIICVLAKKMGYSFNYSSPNQIMEEITELTPVYSGINYSELDKNGVNWVKNVEKKRVPEFHIVKSDLIQGDNIRKRFPFILSTGNIMFHLGTYSNNSKVLKEIYPECRVEINPDDAKDLNINNGDTVEIISPNSGLRLKTKVTKKSTRGVVFIPSNFDHVPVNLLYDRDCIPMVKILKVIS